MQGWPKWEPVHRELLKGCEDHTLKTIVISCTQFLGYENLKEKQLEAMASFMEGNDSFMALPTSRYTRWRYDGSIQQHPQVKFQVKLL